MGEPTSLPPHAMRGIMNNCVDLHRYNPEAYQKPGNERERDHEIEAMKAIIYEMTSRVHHATSSAPEIDHVLQEMLNTPFSFWISNTLVWHTRKIKLPSYADNSDPTQYLIAFNIEMGCTQFIPKDHMAWYCQLFIEKSDRPWTNLVLEAGLLNWQFASILHRVPQTLLDVHPTKHVKRQYVGLNSGTEGVVVVLY